MTKVYLIDEELLRQVLDALTITKKFCGGFAADECPDTVAIPINETYRKLEEMMHVNELLDRWVDSASDIK